MKIMIKNAAQLINYEVEQKQSEFERKAKKVLGFEPQYRE